MVQIFEGLPPCKGAVALAEFLAESRLIQRLDLHQNRVKLGGLMALSLALRINCSLSHLGVDPIPPQELVGGTNVVWLRISCCSWLTLDLLEMLVDLFQSRIT